MLLWEGRTREYWTSAAKTITSVAIRPREMILSGPYSVVMKPCLQSCVHFWMHDKHTHCNKSSGQGLDHMMHGESPREFVYFSLKTRWLQRDLAAVYRSCWVFILGNIKNFPRHSPEQLALINLLSGGSTGGPL